MVRFNAAADQIADRNKTATDMLKSIDGNNNINSDSNSDAGQCLEMANETISSNEDEDVYLNVTFNCKTNTTTNPLFKNDHKTFNRSHKHDPASMGNGLNEKNQESSSDEIYENYSTSTDSKIIKVEIHEPMRENGKTLTKHDLVKTKLAKVPKEAKNGKGRDSTSPSSSEVDASTSDDANITNSSEATIVNEQESVYENIETIRDAMMKNKTYKIKNGNGNRFAGENLLVINEHAPKNKDSLDRKPDAVGGADANVDKIDGKVKSHSRSKARVRVRYVMPAASLSLAEDDVVRLALEFLHNRGLHISQLSLERESGLVNGAYSDDVLFLRQLILDGQWEDVLEFVQPLGALQAFDMKKFRYIILRHKFIELICIKSETAALTGTGGGLSTSGTLDSAVDEMVALLAEIEKICPSKQDHVNLCLLLTLPRLTDHLNFKDWNPSNARVTCFREVYPLVDKFLPGSDKKTSAVGSAKNDRLVQLVIKGVLYESCVKYCQIKATGSSESAGSELTFSSLLDNCPGLNESDLSLLSWLQSIPGDTFSVPFEQKTLNVDIARLEKPSLETSWTEHMLITPIKPNLFPHSATSFTRPRSGSDMMSRSLVQAGGARSRTAGGACAGGPGGTPGPGAGDMMTRSSFASFHLTGMKTSKLMTTSVDKLFENDSDVFLSSSYHHDFGNGGGLPSISELNPRPDAQSPHSPPSSSPDHTRGKESSPASSCATARSSRRDSLSEKNMSAATTVVLSDTMPPSLDPATYDQGDLLKEYQRSKNRMQRSGTLESSSSRIMDDSIRSVSSNGNKSISAAASSVTPKSAADSPANHNQVPKTNGFATNGDTSYEPVKPFSRSDGDGQSNSGRPRFVPVTTLEDAQAVRCAEFHPNGNIYAVGSNSKTLRICAYPKLTDLREDHTTYQPTVLFKRTRHHKGSIYCMAWTPVGDLMATGSNDKTVKLMKFNEETSNLEGQEIELNMHDGTVRDVCFIEDTSNKSSLLISGGAGDCKIYVTDCATGQAFQALSGHSGHVLSLYSWGGAMFISGSHDRTVRFWDLRTRGCTNVLSPVTVPGTRQGAPVSALCVDPSGRLMVSGHEDASCVLYDIRGSRPLQTFKPHTADVRSIRFSPSAYYLLTGGYDNKLVLTDLQGDLTMPLPSVVVASHSDKVISARWHPSEFSFLSTSADKTATLWALPPV